MKHTFKRYALFTAFSSLLAAIPARAANSFYAPGDLVLFFQQEGGANTIYANLGSTASFRGTAAGATDGTNSVNFLDLSTTLSAAFGSNWASSNTIYAGLAGVWGTSVTSPSLQQGGDPHRTLYVSSPRNDVGTVGQLNSTGWDLTLAGNTAMTGAAGGIFSQNNAFENNYDAQASVSLTSISTIDDQNPFLFPGIQGNAFQGTFAGGVQQQGGAGNFGAFPAGGASNVEFALDLYRILARTDVAGQIGGNLRQGSFEGTVTVGNDGKVSFLAVPEPSSLALASLAAGSILLRRRRSA